MLGCRSRRSVQPLHGNGLSRAARDGPSGPGSNLRIVHPCHLSAVQLLTSSPARERNFCWRAPPTAAAEAPNAGCGSDERRGGGQADAGGSAEVSGSWAPHPHPALVPQPPSHIAQHRPPLLPHRRAQQFVSPQLQRRAGGRRLAVAVRAEGACAACCCWGISACSFLGGVHSLAPMPRLQTGTAALGSHASRSPPARRIPRARGR